MLYRIGALPYGHGPCYMHEQGMDNSGSTLNRRVIETSGRLSLQSVTRWKHDVDHYVLMNSMAMNGQGHAELFRRAIVCALFGSVPN